MQQSDLFHVLDLDPTSAKMLDRQKISIFSPTMQSIIADDSLLVTAGITGVDPVKSIDIEITAYDARAPVKLVKQQLFVVEKRPPMYESFELWDFHSSTWLSLGDGLEFWSFLFVSDH